MVLVALTQLVVVACVTSDGFAFAIPMQSWLFADEATFFLPFFGFSFLLTFLCYPDKVGCTTMTLMCRPPADER